MNIRDKIERRIKRLRDWFGPRICETRGCWNSTASESVWYCVDHWPVDGLAVCPQSRLR